MATYVQIEDEEVAPESPLTTSLLTRLRDNALAYLGAPTGSKILQRQDAAILGWTIDTTYNDRALRVTNGTLGQGGSVTFSTLFGRTSTDAFTLDQSKLPSVAFTLTINIADPGHAHNLNQLTALLGLGGIALGSGGAQINNLTNGTQSSSTGITASGTAASGGSGAPITAPIDMRVGYVDVKIIEKQ